MITVSQCDEHHEEASEVGDQAADSSASTSTGGRDRDADSWCSQTRVLHVSNTQLLIWNIARSRVTDSAPCGLGMKRVVSACSILRPDSPCCCTLLLLLLKGARIVLIAGCGDLMADTLLYCESRRCWPYCG